MGEDSGDITIATYGEIVESYARRNHVRSPAVIEFLDRVAALAPSATVLELGSGPGDDADLLERRGLTVQRTDATPAFVARLRERGHAARVLDVRRDELGGPYGAILANAVLLHLTTIEFSAVLARIHAATSPGGVFAFTVKEGDGGGLTSAGIGRPRWFTYWREAPLRDALALADWRIESLQHVTGARDDWLHVIARRGG